MRHYESIFILNPNIDEAEAEKLSLRMQEVITANGGEVSNVEKWGKRKLAYEVAKFKKGEYVLVQYSGEAKTVSELERNFKMADPVIKYMTVKLEKEMVEANAAALAARAEAEKLAASEAEAKAQAAVAAEAAAPEAAPEEAPAEAPDAAPEAAPAETSAETPEAETGETKE